MEKEFPGLEIPIPEEPKATPAQVEYIEKLLAIGDERGYDYEVPCDSGNPADLTKAAASEFIDELKDDLELD